MDADVRARASAWLAADPDERDRTELAGLLADSSTEAAAELADRFAGRRSSAPRACAARSARVRTG